MNNTRIVRDITSFSPLVNIICVDTKQIVFNGGKSYKIVGSTVDTIGVETISGHVVPVHKNFIKQTCAWADEDSSIQPGVSPRYK